MVTIRGLTLFLVLFFTIVTAQWGRPPVVVEKTIIQRPGFGRGPAWGPPPPRRGWGGPPQTIIKETIIRPG